jgi:hypothetical protein
MRKSKGMKNKLMMGALAVLTLSQAGNGQETVNGGMVVLGPLRSSGPQAAVDFTAAGSTAPVKSGTLAARPGTCVVGQLYFATDAAAGQNLALCTSAGTWTIAGGTIVSTVTPSANAIPQAGAGGTLAAGWVPTLNQSTTGNAATATALATLPTLCTGGLVATGVLANGNATGCTTAGSSVTSPFSSVLGTLTYSAASGMPCLSGTVTAAQVAALGAVTSANINLATVTEPFSMLTTFAFETTIFTATGTLTMSVGTNSTAAFYLPAFSLKQGSPVVNFGASGLISAASGTTTIVATFTGSSNLSGVAGGPLTVKICGGSI